jgi:hypothetical protein
LLLGPVDCGLWTVDCGLRTFPWNLEFGTSFPAC